MAIALPGFVSSSYDVVCNRLERLAPARTARPGLARTLGSFGAAVENESIPVDGVIALDPTNSLTSLDDQDLAEWWGNDCWIRELLWAVAASGKTPPIDWLMWMLVFAEQGGTPRLGSLLAADVRDLSRVAFRSSCGTQSDLQLVSHRSPVRVFQWLASNRIAIASTAGSTSRPCGTIRLTRAWIEGCPAAAGDEFDALILACALGGTAIVVEMDHGYRRHVLVPIESTDPADLDADHYCIDLLRRRGGWMSRLGTWTWEDARANPLPPLASLPEVLETASF